MFLTAKEEAILDGEYGESRQLAMSILVKLGDIYDADRMIKVENAHIDAASYGAIYDAGLDLCEKFSHSGVTFEIPTTLNVSAIDFEKWQEFRVPKCFAEKQIRLARAYNKMGAITTWTCAPYQYGANLRFNQNIAWGESNAVGFANSVIGARTNKFGDLVDVCAAIIGEAPRFGLYLDENRRGQVLFKLDKFNRKSFSTQDYAVMGFLIGSIAKIKIPVVKGIPRNITIDQLKTFGAAAATSGSGALYHICGVTPEARTLNEAFSGMKPEEEICIGTNEFKEAREKLSTTGGGRADVIVLGCPHYSVEQLRKVSCLIRGKKVKKDTELWIFTSKMAKTLACEMGIINVIETAGGKVTTGTCMLNFPIKQWGFNILMTDSAKMAYFSPGLTCNDTIFKNTEECIKFATDASC